MEDPRGQSPLTPVCSEVGDYDALDERPMERWAPVGASAMDEGPSCSSYYCGEVNEVERLRRLEEEQEQLNASLIALTSHFAQVQFRLKQIVDASPEEKEGEFDQEGKLAQQREKQMELMLKLKEQLEDLEKYAYETGEAGIPQSMLLERQSVVIEQLKGKLPLDLDNLDKMSPEELKYHVDRALRELINPMKMKEQLVQQLKTQITDLERFIEFLQGAGMEGKDVHCTCTCPVHSNVSSRTEMSSCNSVGRSRQMHSHRANDRSDSRLPLRIVRRAMALLQLFALTQFGCGRHTFEKNLLKRTEKGNHWGDLRATLEVAVSEVIELANKQEPPLVDSDYTSDSEDVPIVQCNEKLTTAVRKDLASAIRDLMQHGLMTMGQSSSLVPFGCFATRSSQVVKPMHAWDIILKYYEIKNGRVYNETPARKLSQSFNLEIVGGTAITPKQTLLSAIGGILSSHTPLKRSADSHFKAFVCAGLNKKKLVQWLRLIFKTRTLIEHYYQPWSYISKTGFEDALSSLEKLNQIDFDLPVDLAVRQLQNIKDAF